MNASTIPVSKSFHPVSIGCLKTKNQVAFSHISFQRSRTQKWKQIVHTSSSDGVLVKEEEEEEDDMDPSLVAESMLIGITSLVILPKMVGSLHNLKKEKTTGKQKFKTSGWEIFGNLAKAWDFGMLVAYIIFVVAAYGSAAIVDMKDDKMKENVKDYFFKKLIKDIAERASVKHSVGDDIKIADVEGKIVKIGFPETVVEDLENNVVTVPNASFVTQMVKNKSLSNYRTVRKVYRFGLADREKIHLIVKEIENLMKNDIFVYLGAGIPYCHLYEAEKDFEVHLGFNLVKMGEEQLEYAKLDLLSRILNYLRDEEVKFP